MDLSKDRVVEFLEDMARSGHEGVKRTRESIKMLSITGEALTSITQGLDLAERHARVMAEAARLLKDQK